MASLNGVLKTELVETNRALQKEIGERKRAEKEILKITQQEQWRFGAQLHDGLGQELSAILMFTKSLSQKIARKNGLEIPELRKISDMLHAAVGKVREMARGIYPGQMEGVSLMNFLEDLACRTEVLAGVTCRFHCPEPVWIDDNEVATHLYQIAQEAVNNAVKHGRPAHIEVGLVQDQTHVTLTVKDDGTGCSDFKTGKGIGLKIMKHRAHIMGAYFQIEPNLPHGVVLECRIGRRL